jgi:hypothetical protein
MGDGVAVSNVRYTGAACTLPREVVQVKNLRLPQMPANELENAVNRP